MVLPMDLIGMVTPGDLLGSHIVAWGFNHLWHFPWTDQGMVLAQNMSDIKSINVAADFQKSWNHFIKSGQVWALGIGFVLGWIFRNFTGS